LATETGESLTEAVPIALLERLTAVRRRAVAQAPQPRFGSYDPRWDPRSADEILGYDDFGLPRQTTN
jgi:hypothetical protein